MTSPNHSEIIPTLHPSQFINQKSINDYICPLCKGVYYQPILDQCGDTFCSKCYDTIINEFKICPISKQPLKGKGIPIPVIDGIISKKEIYCKNKDKGCKWIGLVQSYNEHLGKECLKESVECSHEGCDVKVLREVYELHKRNCPYRKDQCEACLLMIPIKDVEEHKRTCQKVKVECPQKCGYMIAREKMESHIKDECEMTIVDCPFKKYGCDEKNILRKDLEEKVKECGSKHVLLLLNNIKALEEKTNVLTKNLPNNVKSSFYDKLKSMKVNTKRTSEVNSYNKQNKKIEEDTQFREINHKGNNSNIRFIQTKRISESELPITLDPKIPKLIESNYDHNSNRYNVMNNHHISYSKFENNTLPLFDTKNISNTIYITGNIARYISSEHKSYHKFLFTNRTVDINSHGIYTWSVRFLTESKWIGIGLCDKDKVLSNKSIFTSQNDSFNHGCFLISSNQYSWNCQNNKEEHKDLSIPLMKRGNEIIMTYSSITNELIFKGNTEYTLHNVTPITVGSSSLTPCILFLNNGDSAQFNFY